MRQPFSGQNIDPRQFKVTYPTPNYLDRQLITKLETNPDDYLAVLYGTPPPENANPDYLLCLQAPIDWNVVQRVFAKDRSEEDVYNYSIVYDEESNSHPAFIRDYLVRRSQYGVGGTPKQAALAGMYKIRITAGGSGYSQATVAVVISGGTGSGGAATAIVSNGAVVHIAITAQGNYTSAPTVTITGGSGATATAFVQGAGCLLTKEQLLRTPDSPTDSLWVVVRRVYETMPGPVLTTVEVSAEFNGEDVTTTKQRGLHGTLTPDSGNGVIASIVTPETSVVDVKTTKGISSDTLPDDLVYAFWDFVPLPMLLFDITHDVFCNLSEQAKVITNYDTAFGSSEFRKHRVTISYSYTKPDPDLSASSFETADVRYAGAVISFGFNNVLNDALDFDGEVIIGGCTWDEDYTFAATSPDATTFYAGEWYVRNYKSEQLGSNLWKSTKIEFYSAPGNPSIT